MRRIWYALTVAAVAAFATAPAAGPALAQIGGGVASSVPQVAPDDHVLGNKDAPVTIIEYASMTCPHCAAFDKETLPKIKKDWIDAGKAKLVYRNFPFDRAALEAAKLAQCIGPEHYFGFVDVVFQSQDNWIKASDPVAALGRYAKLAGMSDQQIQDCSKNEDVANKIVAGRLAAEKEYGVESTPTFFINGKKLVGALPYDQFDAALKAAAAQAKS
ncbi:MAG TPA: DsbA family protein [Stellaceae bacterium]